MASIRWSVILVLLIICFVLKTYLNRTPRLLNLIYSLIDFPINIIFLGISFVVAYTITAEGNDIYSGLVIIVIYILAMLFVVIFSRIAESSLDEHKIKTTIFFSFISYIICITGLIIGIKLVTGGINICLI